MGLKKDKKIQKVENSKNLVFNNEEVLKNQEYGKIGKEHASVNQLFAEKSEWAVNLKYSMQEIDEFTGTYANLFSSEQFLVKIEEYIERLYEIKHEFSGKSLITPTPVSRYVNFSPKGVNLLTSELMRIDNNTKARGKKAKVDVSEIGNLNMLKRELNDISQYLKKEINREMDLLEDLPIDFKEEPKPKPVPQAVAKPVPPNPAAVISDDTIRELPSSTNDEKAKPEPAKKEKKRKRDIFMCCFFCVGSSKSKDKKTREKKTPNKLVISEPIPIESATPNKIPAIPITQIQAPKTPTVPSPVQQPYVPEAKYPVEDFCKLKLAIIEDLIKKIAKLAVYSKDNWDIDKIEELAKSAYRYKRDIHEISNKYKSKRTVKDFCKGRNFMSALIDEIQKTYLDIKIANDMIENGENRDIINKAISTRKYLLNEISSQLESVSEKIALRLREEFEDLEEFNLVEKK